MHCKTYGVHMGRRTLCPRILLVSSGHSWWLFMYEPTSICIDLCSVDDVTCERTTLCFTICTLVHSVTDDSALSAISEASTNCKSLIIFHYLVFTTLSWIYAVNYGRIGFEYFWWLIPMGGSNELSVCDNTHWIFKQQWAESAESNLKQQMIDLRQFYAVRL